MFKHGVLHLGLTILVSTLLFNAKSSRATSLTNKNESFHEWNDHMFIEDYVKDDYGFVIASAVDDPHKPRIAVGAYTNNNKPSPDCGRGIPKNSCLPKSQPATVREHCKGIYKNQNRGCL